MNYLDPDILSRVQSLEWHARRIVDGYLTGIHRGSQHGFSVEFAQHREYVLGDDIRHIDWKVWGRTERYFLKQYELETNFSCWLLVDASESMSYASGSVTKYDYAAILAATLAHLVLRQHDSVGLAIFDSTTREVLRPSSQSSRLKDVVRILASASHQAASRIGSVLHELSERMTQRGVVAIFSDLFDDPGEILEGLKRLRFFRHDIILFHILDPAEKNFPFNQTTLFRGLEHLPELLTDPRGVRAGYLEELNRYLQQITEGCRTHEIGYVPITTDSDPGQILAQYLGSRKALD